MSYLHYFFDPAHWTGAGGIPQLSLQHLYYTLVTLFFSTLIGFPIGLYVGHTRRGVALIAGLANALRALPSLGLLVLLVILLGPVFQSALAFEVPSLIVLVLLGVPAIMTATYAGVSSVDPSAVDAARGMGYRPLQVLLRVELPCALPLILSGLRNASLQIISTATIAAYVSLGGLGRLIIDGQAQRDYGQMLAGAISVGLLVLVVDGVIGLASRLVVSRGLTPVHG